jgi:hypothetical protein
MSSQPSPRNRTLPLYALLAAVAGCGAGTTNTAAPSLRDSGLDSGNPARSARTPGATGAAVPAFKRFGLYLTATAPQTPAYAHVFVTLRKIELLGADEQTQTVFDDPTGTLIDLSTLSNATFVLAAPALPERPVARIRVTLGPSLQLFTPGQTDGETVVFADALPRDSAGNPTLLIALPKPTERLDRLTIAADLETLKVTDGKAALALKPQKETPGTQRARRLLGTIHTVSGDAPAQSFVLTLADGATIPVATSATTVVSQADRSASPKLADGAPVAVTGTLDPERKIFTATRIVLGAPGETLVSGAIARPDAAAQTFTLNGDGFQGLLPTRLPLTVTVTETTALRSRGGLPVDPETFWATIARPDARVEAEGTYEPVTASFQAKRLLLLGEPAKTREASIEAPVTSTDPKALTLLLGAPTAWDGFLASEKGLKVTLTPSTVLTDPAGAPLAAEAFFAGATAARPVRVIGLLGPDGLSATRIALGAPTKPPAEKPVEEKKATDDAPPAEQPADGKDAR